MLRKLAEKENAGRLARWSSPEEAESGAMNGTLLESFTVSEITKSYQNAGWSHIFISTGIGTPRNST